LIFTTVATRATAADWLQSLDQRPIGESATVDERRSRLGGPLPVCPVDPLMVVQDLVWSGGTGTGRDSLRSLLRVLIGGGLPAAVAADWLTTVWDQCSALYARGPAASVAEEVAGAWLRQLLGLPRHASFAFVLGCQTARLPAWPRPDTTSCNKPAGMSKNSA
jgi:hypothetical protein